jgi:hypothetical protein
VVKRTQPRVERGNSQCYTERRPKKDKDPDTVAYMYAVLLANAGILEEALKMDKTGGTALDEVLERMGLIAKWEDRGRAKWEAVGEARGKKTAWEKVVSLMKQGPRWINWNGWYPLQINDKRSSWGQGWVHDYLVSVPRNPHKVNHCPQIAL